MLNGLDIEGSSPLHRMPVRGKLVLLFLSAIGLFLLSDLRLLAPAFPRVVVTATSSPRALPAPKLADAFRSRGVEPAATYPAVAEAVGALAGVAYVAVGSITLAGEVAGLLGR